VPSPGLSPPVNDNQLVLKIATCSSSSECSDPPESEAGLWKSIRLAMLGGTSFVNSDVERVLITDIDITPDRCDCLINQFKRKAHWSAR